MKTIWIFLQDLIFSMIINVHHQNFKSKVSLGNTIKSELLDKIIYMQLFIYMFLYVISKIY